MYDFFFLPSHHLALQLPNPSGFCTTKYCQQSLKNIGDIVVLGKDWQLYKHRNTS